MAWTRLGCTKMVEIREIVYPLDSIAHYCTLQWT